MSPRTAADNRKVALSSYRGKPLLLEFWATWCAPCLASMPAFNRLYMDVKDKGVAVVSVDEDTSADTGAAYLTHHNYSWINYHDTDSRVGQAFKFESLPMTILVDAQGKIVYYHFGGDEDGVRKAIAALGPDLAPVGNQGLDGVSGRHR